LGFLFSGATNNILDDVERALEDGVNLYKGLTKDGRFVAGGGATEIELARQVCVRKLSAPHI